jgi:paraquat-inducible protein B
MSKPANKTLIGIFVLGAIALVVIAIVVLGSGKLFKKTLRAVCYFEGSVGGLNIGAPVVFRGVRIGSVTDVVLSADSTKLIFTIPVYIELEPDKIRAVGPAPKKLGENLKALIDRGLSARLETQSIVTGQMQVALDIRPDKLAKFVEFKIDTHTPEIPTIPTPLQELTKKIEQLPLEQIVKDIGSAVDGINRVVNSPEITKFLQSASAAAEETKHLVRNLNTKIDPLVLNVDAGVNDARKLLQNIDRQVEPLGPTIQKSLEGIEKTIQTAEITLTAAQKTIEGIQANVGEGSPLAYELNKTLEEVSSLARSIRHLADYLERHPESVLRGK